MGNYIYSQNFLEPEDGVVSGSYVDEYERTLEDILAKQITGYSIFKVVAIPSFQNEWALAIDIENDKATVTSIAFGNKVWSNFKKMNPDYKIAKNKKEIRFEIALKIKNIIASMLQDVRYPEYAQFGNDGEDYHFSNWTKEYGFRFGKTWSPNEGSKCYYLVELAKLLNEYVSGTRNDKEIIELLEKFV